MEKVQTSNFMNINSYIVKMSAMFTQTHIQCKRNVSLNKVLQSCCAIVHKSRYLHTYYLGNL